jgi:hypothetical protein
MEDNFLGKYRKTPRAEFSKSLYERIDQPMKNQHASKRATLLRWSPLLAGVGALLLLVMVFVFPPAQAAAQGFLDLFRVRRFSAIAVDPARLDQIRSTNIDFQAMFGSSVQEVKTPTSPAVVADSAAATKAAGFNVLVPQALPSGYSLQEIRVQGEGITRITADTSKLQSLLDALQINDIKPPAKLNGAVLTVRKPAMVVMSFTTGRDPVSLVQGPSPEVTLPDGVNLSDLGVIGLRILGLNAADAKQFASAIDWRTTLLVPVPTTAASFREVAVRNTKGIMITTGGTGGASYRSGEAARQHSLLLFSEGDLVFGLEGGPLGTELVDMANSLH